MSLEIERKFLLASNDWRQVATSTLIRQGYLSRDPDGTVRKTRTLSPGFRFPAEPHPEKANSYSVAYASDASSFWNPPELK